MNTKNIFRTLLMAVLLLVGANSAKAGEIELWVKGASQSQVYDVTIGAESFVGISATAIKIYTDNVNIQFLTADKQTYYWSSDNNNPYVYGGSPFANAHFHKGSTDAEDYFEFDLDDDILNRLQSEGLWVGKTYGSTIYKISLVTASEIPFAINKADNIENGDVAVKDDLTEALFGTEITLIAFPADGYKLKNFVVTTKAGYSVTVRNGKFSMPNGDVIISAEFIDENIIWQGDAGTVEIPTAEFVGISADAILRVWVSKNVFEIGVTESGEKLFYSQYQTVIRDNDLDTYYVEDGGYFEFTLTDEMLEKLAKGGLKLVSNYSNGHITQVMLIPGTAAPKHTLTIVVDGEEDTRQVAEGVLLPNLLQSYERTGYTLTWENMPEDGKMPANDLTITALFTINSYTLTYMIDGEKYGDSETYEYGATITPRGEPTLDGYTFSGWNGLPTTMPDHDVTVTGSYTKNREYVSASVGSHGYATFSSTRPLDFSGVSGVKAYIAQSVSDNTVELVQVTGTCAAETGLVLIGDNNNYQIPVASTDGESYSSSQNLLVAVLSSTEIKSSSDFVLTYQDGRVAFAATGGQAAVIPAGHAYLHWAQSRGARALKVVVAGETTGINAVENALTGNEVIYNLRGQRVVNPGKGVYIINGKKVVLK